MWRGISTRLLSPAVLGDANEARLVAAYLASATGVFVEIGAHEPVFLSQTHHLEKAGWRGVLIEPLAECAEMLRRERTAQVFQVAAGSPEDEGRVLPLLVAGALSTLGPSLRQLDARASGVRNVPVRTVDSILCEAGIDNVDFVSIDVEGTELAVLRGFALEKFRPRLVLIEDGVQHLDKHRYMLERGYKLVRRTALNNWYIPRETAFPVSLFGRLQLLRKLYLGLWPRRLKQAVREWRKARRERSAALPIPG
jgi:FkbM family methyltransferase